MPPSSFNHIAITLSLCVTALTKAHSTVRAGTFLSIILGVQGKKNDAGEVSIGPSGDRAFFPIIGWHRCENFYIAFSDTRTRACGDVWTCVEQWKSARFIYPHTKETVGACRKVLFDFIFFTPEEHLYWERVHLTSSLLSRSLAANDPAISATQIIQKVCAAALGNLSRISLFADV
jgi:hypothetical protein